MNNNLLLIVDVHLGRLAKLLRLLGIDTLYQNNYSKAELIKTAVEQQRILLSRNTSLASNPFLQTLIILSEDPVEQLRQVVQHFGLGQSELRPYTRCLVCNEILSPVAKSEIEAELPPNTRRYYDEFWRCSNCRRIYWKGAHYERMQQLIAAVAAR